MLEFLAEHALWVYVLAGCWAAVEVAARVTVHRVFEPLRASPTWVVVLRSVLAVLTVGTFAATFADGIRFGRPGLLWLLLLIPVIVALSLRSLSGLSRQRRLLAVALRCLVLALLVLALADLQRKRVGDDAALIVLLDLSNSIPEDMHQEALAAINSWAEKAKPTDSVKLMTFAGDIQAETPFVKKLQVYNLQRIPLDREQTDLAGAVRTALDSFPPDTRRRLVVVSDGNQNVGDVRTEAAAAKARGIPIDTITLLYGTRNEVLVDFVRAPAQANEKETVDLAVGIRATKSCRARVRLFDSHDNDREQKISPAESKNPWIEVELEGGAGSRGRLNTILIPREVLGTGLHRWRVAVEPIDEGSEKSDYRVVNNVGTAATAVQGNPLVLLVSPDAANLEKRLIEALSPKRLGIRLDTCTPDALPAKAELFHYDAIIFSDVPAGSVAKERWPEFEQYVKDAGGGFVMIGGEDSFGAGEWKNTPIENLLPVNLDVKNIKVHQKGALVLVMHACEMPEGNFWGQTIAIEAVKTLSRLDHVGVIDFEFGGGPNGNNWVVPLQEKLNEPRIISLIKKMQMGDMPDFHSIVSDAHFALKGSDAANKHILIISDGDPAPPSDAMVAKLKTDGITVSCVAVSPHSLNPPGPELTNFKKIVDRTNRDGRGSFYIVDDRVKNDLKVNRIQIDGKWFPLQTSKELPQIFVKETKTVRRPLITNMPDGFVPAVAKGSGSPLMEGIDPATIRPLRGYVLTTRKPDASVPVVFFDKKQPGDPDPILAHWQYGIGRSVAWTSDARDKWASHWVRNYPEYERLWEQIIRWVQRPKQDPNVQATLVREGDRARLELIAVDASRRIRTDLNFTAKVIRPDGKTFDLPLLPTAAGGHSAKFPVGGKGAYFVVAGYRDRDEQGRASGPIRYVRAGLDVAYEDEYRTWGANASVMEALAIGAGGESRKGSRSADFAELDIFRREGLAPAESWQSLAFTWNVRKQASATGKLWDLIVNMPLPALLALVFLFDVCVRRVMIDPRAIAGVFVRFYRRWTAVPLGPTGESLDALRTRRREADQRRETDQREAEQRRAAAPRATIAPPPPTAVVEPPPRTTSAPPPVPPSTPAAPPASAPASAPADMNRLLAAKKRAREELDKDKKGPDPG